MPFVNIQIIKGHSKKRKDEMARRVVDAISDVTKLPREAVWVVFEDVSTDDWYLGDRSVRRIRSEKK
jgi:4-oxalocrotonate tautomerase